MPLGRKIERSKTLYILSGIELFYPHRFCTDSHAIFAVFALRDFDLRLTIRLKIITQKIVYIAFERTQKTFLYANAILRKHLSHSVCNRSVNSHLNLLNRLLIDTSTYALLQSATFLASASNALSDIARDGTAPSC